MFFTIQISLKFVMFLNTNLQNYDKYTALIWKRFIFITKYNIS